MIKVGKIDIHMSIFDAKYAVNAQLRKLFGHRRLEKVLRVILSTQFNSLKTSDFCLFVSQLVFQAPGSHFAAECT